MQTFQNILLANGVPTRLPVGPSTFLFVREGTAQATFRFVRENFGDRTGAVSEVIMRVNESIRLPQPFDVLEITQNSGADASVTIIVGQGDFQRDIPGLGALPRTAWFVNVQAMGLNSEFPYLPQPYHKRVTFQADPDNPGRLYVSELGGGAAAAGHVLEAGASLTVEINADGGDDTVIFSDTAGQVLRFVTEYYPDLL